MFHRTRTDLNGTAISHGGANTQRLLLAGDGLGFSISVVTAPKGGPHTIWYRHHWEASYMISGRALLEELSGEKRSWELGPGDMYCVGPNDHHRVTDLTECTVLGVFNPALSGTESHDAEGNYPRGATPPPAGHEAMFVYRPADLQAMGRAKTSKGGSQLLRYLLDADGLGLTWSDVHFQDGSEANLWYKNHWEGNYVFGGEGELHHHGTGEELKLTPGMMYAVGPDDRHTLKAVRDFHIVSLFNPPLSGTEVHDEDGAYPPTGPLPPGPQT